MTKKILLIAFAWVGIALAGAIKYTYDDAGRLIGAAYPDGTVITYTYDKSGNLLSRTVNSGGAPAAAATMNGSASVSRVVPGEFAIHVTAGWPLPTIFLTPRVVGHGESSTTQGKRGSDD